MSILRSGLVTVFDSRTWEPRIAKEEMLALPLWQPGVEQSLAAIALKLLLTRFCCVESESQVRSEGGCYGQMAFVLVGLVLRWMPAFGVNADTASWMVNVHTSPLRSESERSLMRSKAQPGSDRG